MFRITCRSIGSSIKRYGSFETNGIIRSCSVVRFGSNDASKTTLDYFHILGIDRSFSLSTDELKSKYKRLMTEYHPDRHASASEEEKLAKASTASNVTRAYDIIADPLSRALHLLELHGASIGEDDNSIVDNNLLMEIMEAREEVDNASTDEELRPLLLSCQKQQTELCNEIAKSFQEESIDLDAAKYQVAKLQYLNRIEETIVEKISSVH